MKPDTQARTIPINVSIKIGPHGQPIATCESPIHVNGESTLSFRMETPDYYFTGLSVHPSSKNFEPPAVEADRRTMTVVDLCLPEGETCFHLQLGFADKDEKQFMHDPEVINSPRV